MVYPVSFLPAQRFNSKVTFSGYTPEQKAKAVFLETLRTKNPFALIDMLNLLPSTSPLYDKEVDGRSDTYYTPNSLYKTAEENLIKLIESQETTIDKVQDMDRRFKDNQYQNYQVSDQVFHAIQKRLG